MRLTRVRIEALRHFREPIEIGGLEDGVNLFVGPNGAGKSTIVRAIRAAFFERHGSGSVTDLLPWGESGVAPSVEVDFASGGHHYRLRKQFLTKARCRLDIDGKALESTEAEGRLADLLGFQYAVKGASKPVHWGVPGLLWIQQGQQGQQVNGEELYDAVAHATDHLRKALDESLGEVASTGGDAVFERVEAEREKLLTRTGQATGELKEAARLLAEARQKVDALAAQLVTYRDQADRFGVLNAQILAGNRAQPWKRFEVEANAAQKSLDRIGKALSALAVDRQILDQTGVQMRLLEQQKASFAEQRGNLEQRRQVASKAVAQLADAELSLSPRRQQLEMAQLAHDQAQSELTMAEQQERRRHQLAQIADLQARHAALEARIAQGRDIAARLNRHRQHSAGSWVSDEHLETLRGNEREIRTACIRQEAVSTTLSYQLEPGKAIQRDGEMLEGAGKTQLVTRTVLTIADVGTITIEPGHDLTKLSAARAKAEAGQAALLQSLGLDSLAAAEQRLQQRKAAKQDAKVEQARLDQVAPKGLDAVSAELASVAGELADVQARLASMVQQSASDQARAVDARSAAAPILAVDDARSVHAQAAVRLRTAQAAEQQARTAWAAARSAAAHAEAERSALQDTVQSTGYQQRLAQNLAELNTTRQRLATLAAKVRDAEQGIAAAQPQVLQQDVDRFAQDAKRALAAHEQQRVDVISLQSQLDAAGANGLEETLAEAQGKLDRLQRRHGQLQQRARALDLLARMLQAKRQALTKRLQAPLLKHLNHYLQLLLPGSRVVIDEALKPVALSMPAGTTTGATAGPTAGLTAGAVAGAAAAATTAQAGGFADLSFGTREQISLISRLAYADLLKEANRPTLIILDDSLVNTDAARLSQMKRILYDAAARHQILLFSCHPERWRDLGAAARDVLSLTSVPARAPTTGG